MGPSALPAAGVVADMPTGEDVRLFVLDVGPSVDSSFHIVGTIFHDVTKEGVHLEAGNDGNWGSQAVDLSPAQGAVIELRTAEDGMNPIVADRHQRHPPTLRGEGVALLHERLLFDHELLSSGLPLFGRDDRLQGHESP